MKRFFALLLVLSMLTLPLAALGAEPAPKGDAIGMSILGFSTTDLDGNPVDDSILSNAAVTVFNFWASWCGPCVSEMPSFNMLYNNFEATPEADVQVIGVAIDTTDESSAYNYVHSHGYNWLQLRRCAKFMELLNTTASGGGISIPQTIVVDYRGEVLAHQVGSFPTYNALYTFVNSKYQYVMSHYPPTAALLGDADGNGELNAADALAILRMSMGLVPMGDLAVVDIDGSGTVTASDALTLLRQVMGLN